MTFMNTDYKLIEKYRTEIMGFAALCIFVFHGVTNTFYYAFDAHPLFAYICRIGFFGVDIFFFLSGDGLMHSLEHNDLKSYYLRRISRVYFPFFAGGLMQMFIYRLEPVEFVKRITCISFYTESIYSLLWFVPAILTIYLVFPLYHKLMSLFKNKAAFIILTIVIWYMLEMIFRGSLSSLFGFFNRIPIFLMGCLYGAKQEKEELSLEKWIAALAVTAAGLYSLYLVEYKSVLYILPASDCAIPTFLVAVSLPYVLAGIMERFEKSAVIGFIRKIAVFFGMMSLEFYCVQENFVVLYIAKLGLKLLPGVMLLLIFASSVAAGYVLYLVNSLLMKLIRKGCSQKKSGSGS